LLCWFWLAPSGEESHAPVGNCAADQKMSPAFRAFSGRRALPDWRVEISGYLLGRFGDWRFIVPGTKLMFWD
jgi:hypothetical protein